METKAIITLIAAVVAAILLTIGVSHYVSLRKAAAQNEQRGSEIVTTAGVLDDTQDADDDRDTTDAGVTTARIIFEEGRRHADPSRADTAVPDGLRDAYRQRRLARERLARDGTRDVERTEAEDAP